MLSHVQLFATPRTAACQASLSITNSWSLLKLMSIELVMPFKHLILCCPLLLLPWIFPSIRVFSNESVLHIRLANVLELSASASVLPTHIQDWFPLGWTGFISLQSKGLSRIFSSITIWKDQFSLGIHTLYIHRKDWCWSWSSKTLVTWYKDLTHWKRPWCWERLKVGGEGSAEDAMVRQHHRLNGHEFEQTTRDNEGQGSLVCCSPWGHKEVDATWPLDQQR